MIRAVRRQAGPLGGGGGSSWGAGWRQNAARRPAQSDMRRSAQRAPSCSPCSGGRPHENVNSRQLHLVLLPWGLAQRHGGGNRTNRTHRAAERNSHHDSHTARTAHSPLRVKLWAPRCCLGASLEASSGNAPGCTAAQTRPRQPHCRARSCCAESRLRLNSCNMRPRPRAQATRTPRAHANRRRQPAADPCCSSSRWRSATCAARKGNKGLYMGGWGGCAQRRAKGVARGAASYGLRLEQRRLGKGGRGEATPHGARHESRCATQGVGRCGVDKPVFMARRPAAQPLLY